MQTRGYSKLERHPEVHSVAEYMDVFVGSIFATIPGVVIVTTVKERDLVLTGAHETCRSHDHQFPVVGAIFGYPAR